MTGVGDLPHDVASDVDLDVSSANHILPRQSPIYVTLPVPNWRGFRGDIEIISVEGMFTTLHIGNLRNSPWADGAHHAPPLSNWRNCIFLIVLYVHFDIKVVNIENSGIKYGFQAMFEPTSLSIYPPDLGVGETKMAIS